MGEHSYSALNDGDCEGRDAGRGGRQRGDWGSNLVTGCSVVWSIAFGIGLGIALLAFNIPLVHRYSPTPKRLNVHSNSLTDPENSHLNPAYIRESQRGRPLEGGGGTRSRTGVGQWVDGEGISEEVEEWDPMTARERGAIREIVHRLRIIRDIGVCENSTDPSKGVSVESDLLMLFLRGYKHEKHWIQEAAHRLNNTLTWREEVGADSILDNPPANRSEFERFWKSGLVGTDSQGRAVILDKLGEIDPWAFLEAFNRSQFISHRVYAMEAARRLVWRASAIQGKRLYKMNFIIDMSGLSMSHIRPLIFSRIKEYMNLFSTYYPETVKRLIIINSPFLFTSAWAAVKPWVHPLTLNKIQVLGGPKSYLPLFQKLGIKLQNPGDLGEASKSPKSSLDTNSDNTHTPEVSPSMLSWQRIYTELTQLTDPKSKPSSPEKPPSSPLIDRIFALGQNHSDSNSNSNSNLNLNLNLGLDLSLNEDGCGDEGRCLRPFVPEEDRELLSILIKDLKGTQPPRQPDLDTLETLPDPTLDAKTDSLSMDKSTAEEAFESSHTLDLSPLEDPPVRHPLIVRDDLRSQSRTSLLKGAGSETGGALRELSSRDDGKSQRVERGGKFEVGSRDLGALADTSGVHELDAFEQRFGAPVAD